jgi:hypothetical protein
MIMRGGTVQKSSHQNRDLGDLSKLVRLTCGMRITCWQIFMRAFGSWQMGRQIGGIKALTARHERI